MTQDTAPRRRRSAIVRGDLVFGGLVRAAGVFVLVLIAAIVVFLLLQAAPAFRRAGFTFFTKLTWFPDTTPKFGIAAMAFGTVVSSVGALILAVPVALGSALF